MCTRPHDEIRDRFEQFVAPVVALMGRAERRRYGRFYVQGLLIAGGRKNAAQMAESYGGDEQALQQFVSQSPWDWVSVRRALALQMEPMTPAEAAWAIDDTGLPKQGKHSVGVAHQYSGTFKAVRNCQVAVTLNVASDTGSYPVDAMLYLPEAWASDPARRAKVGVPESVLFQTKWAIALDMIDRARSWGLVDRIVVADGAYGMVTDFRAGLRARKLSYVVGVASDTQVWREEAIPQPPTRTGKPGRHRTKPVLPPSERLEKLALSLPRSAWRSVSWRKGSRGCLMSRFAALRLWTAADLLSGGEAEPESWILIEWPEGEKSPTDYWVSNLPAETPLRELVRWAKRRHWIEQNYEELKQEIGLNHFEGRSWRGWHHHVTLTMIAFAFLVSEGFRAKKKNRGLDASQSQA
jgi:SRSO17 transposase